MKELYKEALDYITNHNKTFDNLYNGMLLEVYNEYVEKEQNGELKGEVVTIEDLIDIAENIMGSDYFGEMLTECIRMAIEEHEKKGEI